MSFGQKSNRTSLMLPVSRETYFSSYTVMLFMPVGSLFAVFCLLFGAAAAMGSSDVLFLLGFGLYLVVTRIVATSSSKGDTIFKNRIEIVALAHTIIFY